MRQKIVCRLDPSMVQRTPSGRSRWDSRFIPQEKAYYYSSAHFQLLNHFVFLSTQFCIELSFRLSKVWIFSLESRVRTTVYFTSFNVWAIWYSLYRQYNIIQTIPWEWSTGPIVWIIEYKRDEITIESRDKIVIHISLDRDTPIRILIDFAIWSDFVIRHDFTHRKGTINSRMESLSRIRMKSLKSPMLSKQAVLDAG